MKAIVYAKHGSAAVLEVRELPTPEPGPGEVRIAVHAAGLNFAEVSARQGLYPQAPKPPGVVGFEVAGTIEALGSGVVGWALNDRVWAITHFGGHAEQVVTRQDLVRRLPESLSFEQGAALPVAYATATLLVENLGRLQPNESVLIHQAGGGVGLAALQLCRLVPGVTVFGTSSAGKHDALRARGLDHAIDYRSKDFEAEVRRLTNGRGVDLILDPMGGGHWKKNYRLLAPLGRLVLFGLSNAARPGTRSLGLVLSQIIRSPRWPPMKLMNDNRAVMGLNLGNLLGETSLIAAGLDSLSARVALGTIRPVLDSVHAFSHAGAAQLRLEQRQNFGKVVLVPDAFAGGVSCTH